jgi:hypothetical protein
MGHIGEQGNCPEGWTVQWDPFGCPICEETDPDPPDPSGNPSGQPPPPPPPPPPDPNPPPGGGQVGGPIDQGGGTFYDPIGPGNLGTADLRDEYGNTGPTHELYYKPGLPGNSPRSAQEARYIGQREGAIANPVTQQVYDVAPDVPELSTVDSGPVIGYYSATPINSSSSSLPGGTNIYGFNPSLFSSMRPGDLGGTNTYRSSSSKVGRAKGTLVQGAYGGKSPSMQDLRDFKNNQNYADSVRAIVNWRNPVPTENEIGVTTRAFSFKNGPVINQVAGSAPERGSTRAKDAVSVVSNRNYITFSQDFRRETGVLRRDRSTTNTSTTQLNRTNPLNRDVDVRSAQKDIGSTILGKDIDTGSKNRNAPKGFVGTTARTPGVERDVLQVGAQIQVAPNLAQSQTFLNNNNCSLLVSPSKVQVGGSFHVMGHSYPLTTTRQLFKLAIYIKDANKKTLLVGETKLENTNVARRIATNISTSSLSPGRGHVILTISDGTSIIHSKSEPIELYDPGASLGVPDKFVRSVASATEIGDLANSLVKAGNTTSIRIYTKPGEQILLYGNRTNSGANPAVKLGVTVEERLHNTQHYISVHNFTNAGQLTNYNKSFYGPIIARYVPNQVGPDYKGNVTQGISSIYTTVDSSLISGNRAIIHLSALTQTNRAHFIDVTLGPDVVLPTTELILILGSGNAWTLSFQTPFVFTDLVAFDAGGNGVVPLSPTLFPFQTVVNARGSVLMSGVRRPTWVGLATAAPSGTPLSHRVFKYIKI